jgi:hypothetical protein
LMSPTGQVVSTIRSAQGQASFEVANLAKGVYFVRLTSDKGTTTKTVVVK